MSVWELATRVPLIVRDPWATASHGKATQVMVELVDLMPSLAALAGVPLPEHEVVPLAGVSFAAALADPTLPPDGIKNYTLSQHARCWKDMHPNCGTTLRAAAGAGSHSLSDMCDCHNVTANDIDFMGLSIRVPHFRYTEWHAWNGTALAPVWSTDYGVELYTHFNDTGVSFDDFENVNEATVEKYHDVVTTLRATVRSAFGYP